MNCNVFIKHFRGGRLIDERAMHNVWTRYGEQYLAQMVGALAFSGDPVAPSPLDTVTPERTDRIRYMGLGIGSDRQNNILADNPPLSTAYPVGYADEAYPPDYVVVGQTNGKEYGRERPLSPLIGTLERPVRVSGGTLGYGTVVPTDVWRVGPPDLFMTHQSSQDVTIHATIDALNDGDVAYPPFNLGVPITEAGLFTETAGTTPPYAPLVAYVSFDTMLVDAIDVVEFIWQVKFG